MKKTALFALFLVFLVSVRAEPTTATWYKLNPGEECVTNFVLEAGKTREVEFSGPKYLFIGFKTDASYKIFKKYFKAQPQPVLLRVKGVNSYVGSVAGAGGVFSSVDGKFRFIAENNTGVTLKMMVFKQKPDGQYE